jgi:predicted Zn-dependent peptidase
MQVRDYVLSAALTAALAGAFARGALADEGAPVQGGGPAASAAGAPRFEAALEKRVREKVLANGLKFVVLERREVPVFSVVTQCNVGAVDEHVGITGVAHIFEHMAFKGSREIGTLDYEKESKVLDALDRVFKELNLEKAKGERADKARLDALEKEFAALEDEARKLVVNNEYSVIVEENGGSGLNASTGSDTTQYFVSFPSNKLELWFHLEADRFREPVLREFFKEKGVVMEERRMRTESSPFGKLIEEFCDVAYKAHPYGYPVIGHASDISTLTRAEAAAFFRKYYVPNNMVISIVGDVDAAECFRLAEKYFGALPEGPPYEAVETVEPPQAGEKRVEVESPAQPIVGIGWHKPAATHPDDPVFDVISDILSSGRTSRLYSRLVKEKQIALQAGAGSGFPGNKYPNLFIVYSLPAVGHGADELEKALLEEVERLKAEKVSDAELRRVKRRARANLIRGLNSNSGLAYQLAAAQTVLGDWREAFRTIAKIEAVSADDVMRVAKETFTRRNRTVARIVAPEGASKEGAE